MTTTPTVWKPLAAAVAFVVAGLWIERAVFGSVDDFLKDVKSEVVVGSILDPLPAEAVAAAAAIEAAARVAAETRPVNAFRAPAAVATETRPVSDLSKPRDPGDPRELLRRLLVYAGILVDDNIATATATASTVQTLPALESLALSATGTDPVNPTTGELFHTHPLVAVPGTGLNFAFALSYRSGYSYNGPVGNQWEHNWNARFQYAAGSPATLTRYAGGRVDAYPETSTGSNVFTAPAGFFELSVTRTAGSPASVSRKLQDGTVEIYENLVGNWYFLTSVLHRDRYNLITLDYDGVQRLTRITDTRNRRFVLGYTSTGHLARLEDWSSGGGSADRGWTFDYDSGKLTKVTAPGSPAPATVFAYKASSNLLESVTAPREQAVSGNAYVINSWDTNTPPRVTQQRLGTSSQNITLSYATNTTTETDREGGRRVHHFNASKGLTKIAQERTTNVFDDTIFAQDANGLTTKVVSPAGHGTLSQFTNGQLVATAQADSSTMSSPPANLSAQSSSSTLLVTKYAYKTTSDWVLLTKITDARGNDWQLDRDSLGNITNYKTPAHASDPWVMTYDSNSRLVTSVDPEGRTVALAYGATGLLTKTTVNPASLALATTLGLDQYGQVTKVTDALGKDTVIARNVRGYVTSVTSPVGRVTDYTYDLNDAVSEVHTDVGHADAPNAERQTVYGRTILDVVSTVTVRHGASLGSNRVWTLGLDLEDRVTLVTLPLGNAVQTVYDLRGMAVTKTVAFGSADAASEVFVYDGNGRLVTMKDGLGNASVTTYDSFDRAVTMTDPLGHYRTSTFDSGGNVVTTCAYNSGATKLAESRTEYDLNNRVTKRRTLAQTSGGSAIGSGWLDVTHAYDKSDRLTQQSDSCGCGGGSAGTTTFAFDAAGRQTKTTDAQGNLLTYTFDANSRAITTVSDEVEGPSTKTFKVTYVYDDDGHVLTRSHRGGGSDTALSTIYEPDAKGAVWKMTDPNGNVVRMLRDDFGQTTKIRRQLTGGGSPTYLDTETQFDANGNVVKRICVKAGGNTDVEYVYDAADRVITMLDEANTVERFTYDDAHNVVTRVDRNTTSAALTYDARNQLLTKTYDFAYDVVGGVTIYRTHGPTTVQFAYDGLGRVVTAVNHPDGARVERKWNTLSKLEQEKSWLVPTATSGTGSTSKTVDYAYDANGRVESVLYPDAAFKVVRTYDGLGRLTKLESVESGTTKTRAQWTFHGYARMRGLTLGSDRAREALTYDQYGRATQLSWDRLKSATRYTTIDFKRGYDAGGRVSFERRDYYKASNNALAGGNLDYGDRYYYDGANRLTKTIAGVGKVAASHSAVESAGEGDDDYVATRHFALDEAGNRKTLTYDLPGTTGWRREDHVFDSENQLSPRTVYDWSGSTLTQTAQDTYPYDANGNLKTRSTVRTDGVPVTSLTIKVDAENRIAEATLGSLTFEYRYDPFGRRIERKIISGGSPTLWTRTYFDGVVPIQEFVMSAGSPPSHTRPKFTRLYGPYLVDQILWARGDLYGAGSSYQFEGYYQGDFLGSVQSIVSDVGNAISTEGGVLETYRYNDYGEVFFCDGEGANYSPNASAGEQDFTYTGREWTAEVGMFYYRARWYRPEVGNLISRDASEFIEDSTAYGYADSAPSALIDDDGNKAKPPKLFLPSSDKYCKPPSNSEMDKVCQERAKREGINCVWIAGGTGQACLDWAVEVCENRIKKWNNRAKQKRDDLIDVLDDALQEAVDWLEADDFRDDFKDIRGANSGLGWAEARTGGLWIVGLAMVIANPGAAVIVILTATIVSDSIGMRGTLSNQNVTNAAVGRMEARLFRLTRKYMGEKLSESMKAKLEKAALELNKAVMAAWAEAPKARRDLWDAVPQCCTCWGDKGVVWGNYTGPGFGRGGGGGR